MFVKLRLLINKYKNLLCFSVSLISILLILRMGKLIGINVRLLTGSLGVFVLFFIVYLLFYRTWDYSFNYLFYGFTCFYILLEILGMYISGDGVRNRHDFSFVFCLLIILLTVILSIPVSKYFKRFIDMCLKKGKSEGEKSVKTLSYFFILLISWLPIYAAFYPGVYYYDIPLKWNQYVSHTYGTWNPIVHSFLYGFICDIGNWLSGGGSDYNLGLALYTFLQLIILSLSIAYALHFISTLKVVKVVRMCLTSFYALFPLFPLLGISTTKDTIFSALFLLVFINVVKACSVKALSLKRGIVLLLLLVLMNQFRNNAIYGILLFLIILIFVGLFLLAKRVKLSLFWKLFGVLILSVVLSIITSSAVIRISSATIDNKGEILSIPGQQIARVYIYQMDNLSKEEKEKIEYYYGDGILDYLPEIADPVKGSWDNENYEQDTWGYYKLWVKLGLKYPKEFIVAFLLNTKGLWHIGDITHSTIRDAYLELKFWGPLVKGHTVYEQSMLPWLKELIIFINDSRIYQDMPFIPIIFAPAIYNWIILLGIMIAIYRRKWEAVVPGGFILCYSITLLLGPCILMRYCFAYILAAPFYLLYILGVSRVHSDD